ncbi:MAG: LolA family protein [Terriglobia bacterium]
MIIHPRIKPSPVQNRQATWVIASYCALFLTLWVFEPSPAAMATTGHSGIPIDEYVLQFERSCQGIRTLKADFTQSYFAWGRTRVESGTVYLEQGGKMRWEYQKPEQKLFLSTGKQLLLYIPGEKQLTVSPVSATDDVRVPLAVMLSRLDLKKVFSSVEFANQALHTDPGDRVLRGIPRSRFKGDYSSALIELTPAFDIRRLVVFYPDNSTMQFEFSNIHRNVAINTSLFDFTPPPGTEVIHQ